jgi:hypothetical protein
MACKGRELPPTKPNLVPEIIERSDAWSVDAGPEARFPSNRLSRRTECNRTCRRRRWSGAHITCPRCIPKRPASHGGRSAPLSVGANNSRYSRGTAGLSAEHLTKVVMNQQNLSSKPAWRRRSSQSGCLRRDAPVRAPRSPGTNELATNAARNSRGAIGKVRPRWMQISTRASSRF